MQAPGDGLNDGTAVGSRLASGSIRCAGLVIVMGCVAVAGCTTTSKKASIDPRYGVAPSPLVVGSNEPVPKGGGRYQVGKPYRIGGKWYKPMSDPGNFEVIGTASWYGPGFHGRRTANGEVFDQHSLSAAHPTLPLPSYVRVTNVANGSSVIVRVNDRGPYHGRRVIDVSRRVAEMLDFKRRGMGRVKVQYVGLAPIDGDDSTVLAGTFRDGDSGPAPVPGAAPAAEPRTLMIASKAPAGAAATANEKRAAPMLRSTERGFVRGAPTVARQVIPPAPVQPVSTQPVSEPSPVSDEVRTLEIAGLIVATPRARPQEMQVAVASTEPSLVPGIATPAAAPTVVASLAPASVQPMALGGEVAMPEYGAAAAAATTLGLTPRLPVPNPKGPAPASIDDLLTSPQASAPTYSPAASFAPTGSADPSGLAIGRFVAQTHARAQSGGATLAR